MLINKHANKQTNVHEKKMCIYNQHGERERKKFEDKKEEHFFWLVNRIHKMWIFTFQETVKESFK